MYSDRLKSAAAPGELAHAIVGMSVRCKKCGYNVRGLRVGARCPECATPIWETVQHAVDPDATRLPPLLNPRGVGAGLIWLAICWLGGVFCWAFRSSVVWLEETKPMLLADGWSTAANIAAHLPGPLVLASIWSAWEFARPWHVRESGAVRRDIILMAGSLFVCGATMTLVSFNFVALERAELLLWARPIVTVAALVAMWGLQNILVVIGARSRQYRQAKTARQSIHGLMAALGAVFVGRICQTIPAGTWPSDLFPLEWARVGDVMVAIGYLMLLIGLAYMVVNFWWIRKALRDQPPTIDQLLLPPPAEETTFGGDEDMTFFDVKAKGES